VFNIKNIFLKINKCPLCRSKNKKLYKKTYSNKYSELIANNIKIQEKKLLDYVKNYQCQKCDLIYKNLWFNKKYLNYFYNIIDPVHSKGWDINSKVFSKKYFLKIVNSFIDYNITKLKKMEYQRSIISILTSAEVSKKDSKNIHNFILELKNNNIDYILKKKNQLSKLILIPKKFSRFEGFGNEKLLNHIKSVAGEINSVTEIGCPRWGFLDKKIKIKNKYFFKKKICGYWNKSCVKNDKNCIDTLDKKVKVIQKLKDLNDYVGVYLYLDHTMKPFNLVQNLLKSSKSCGIILESGRDQLRKGIAIQHFTLWNKRSMMYLASMCNKKIDTTFVSTENFANKFYLLY
jgi:hypothetical protein